MTKLETQLLSFYGEDAERVGFVLKTGDVVEVANISPLPNEGFDVSGEDLLKYEGQVTATWHTHPNADNNLSVNDFESFRNWPELEHYIVGNNGVRRYLVEDGEVLIA